MKCLVSVASCAAQLGCGVPRYVPSALFIGQELLKTFKSKLSSSFFSLGLIIQLDLLRRELLSSVYFYLFFPWEALKGSWKFF